MFFGDAVPIFQKHAGLVLPTYFIIIINYYYYYYFFFLRQMTYDL